MNTNFTELSMNEIEAIEGGYDITIGVGPFSVTFTNKDCERFGEWVYDITHKRK